MLASYFLSRTVVPTMVHYLLPAEAHLHQRRARRPPTAAGSGASTSASTAASSASRPAIAARSPGRWPTARTVVVGASRRWSCCLARPLPAARHGLLPHASTPGSSACTCAAPAGTRIEETEARYADVEAVIRETIPADEIQMMHRQHRHPGRRRQPGVQRRLDRLGGRRRDPGRAQSREPRPDRRRTSQRLRTHPARAVSRPGVLLPAGRHRVADPELRPAGADRRADRRPRPEERRTIAARPRAAHRRHPRRRRRPPAAGARRADDRRRRRPPAGAAARLHASATSPRACWSRSRASRRSRPNYWLNPQNGVNYPVAVQTPQYRIDSIDALNNTPVIVPGPAAAAAARQRRQRRERDVAAGVISHYNVQPVLDVLAGVQDARPLVGRERGRARRRRGRARRCRAAPSSPIRGQAEADAHAASRRMAYGMLLAVVLVYLLMAVNFQSWLDPLIILMALPGAIAGVLLDAVADADQHLRAGADGRDHVHRRGDQQLEPAGHVRQRSAARGHGARSPAALEAGVGAPAPGADDGARDDPRHAADVARPRRGRRAERAARPRGDRRAAAGHLRHAVLRARRLQPAAPRGRSQTDVDPELQ